MCVTAIDYFHGLSCILMIIQYELYIMIFFSEHNDRFLTLRFNVSLLGLLLLRLVQLPYNDCSNFLRLVIGLLSQAYHNTGNSLAINDTYIKHWDCIEELWMLSMQSKIVIYKSTYFSLK